MKYQRLTAYKRNKILRCFCLDVAATATAELVGVNRKTVNAHFNDFRERILKAELAESQAETGIFELDESYFGAKKCSCKSSRTARRPIIQGKILEGSTVNADGWGAYDGLILNGHEHYRVYHSKNEFARGKCHVNGIEGFWSFAKRRLSKFNGCKNDKFEN